jgi:hypothetical protein
MTKVAVTHRYNDRDTPTTKEHSMSDMLTRAEAMRGELSRLRRDIHMHPELAFQEVRTAALVADTLREIGGIDMLNNVHDSIDFQYTPGREKAYRDALATMCDFPMLRVPIEVEEDSGPDWAWASYGEDSWRKIMTSKGML